ncbi:hypothetical protein IWQ61_005243 [Dispira simplex]|nr:hypothetical protein IWQ61_005243 [Dispira simplex]
MAPSIKDGKSESDGPQAPFSYDIRVTGDIHPYGEEDDGRTTRVSVKITSNDDIAHILQARRLGGSASRPISIGSPRELLNVDINARVNPLSGDSGMSVSRAPSRLPHNYHRGGVSSSTSIPINRTSYYPYNPSPAPSVRSSASRPQLTITNRSNSQFPPFGDRDSGLEHKSSPKSCAPSDNGWSKRTSSPQCEPLERWDGSLVKPLDMPNFHSLKLGGASGPYNSSESQINATEDSDERARDSGPLMESSSGDTSSRFSRPHSKSFSVVNSDGRDDSTPTSVSIPIQDPPPEPSQALVLSRSLSPPPSLSRRQGSRLAKKNPFPSTTAFPRSATPPPSLKDSNWYPFNQSGGYRPESAQSNVTSVTTTTTTTVQQAITTSYASQPSVHSREHSDSETPYIYSTGSAARLGGAATEDPTASLHNPSISQLHSSYSSFVTFPNVNRLQRAEVHRSQESCYEVCYCCNQLIEAADRIVPVDRPIHRWCLRCHECQLDLTLEDFASLEDEFYCRFHYLKRRDGRAMSRASRDIPVSPLSLPYRPQSTNYRQVQSPSEYRAGSVANCPEKPSVVCTCSCSCQFCPISLYGVTPSECEQGVGGCNCDCLCSICVRAQAIQSNLGMPPPWTPGLEKSMVLYTGTHGPSSTLASRDLKIGGAYTPGGKDTPYTFSRSMHPPDQGCSCDCPCSFCPSSLYGMTSIMEGVNPQACQCHCQCSICMRAQNIYDNFGTPVPQPERGEACLNPGENTPCLLFPKSAGGNGDSSVFECPCSNCQDQRARDAAFIERIMAYHYSLGLSDPSRALSPHDKEYIRLICPCGHCRKFRETQYKPTGSPTLKPRNTPARTPTPATKMGGSSQHQDFGKCPCPNCLAKGTGNDAPNSNPPSGKPKDDKPSSSAKPSSSSKSGEKPKDFGKCPCPNCTASGSPSAPPVAKPPSGKPKDKPPASPSGDRPKDFGTCPCPNCTSGSPATKTPSNDKPPSKPPPPPSKPKDPPSSPPKDFGKCPCPNCTSGGPATKAPSNGKAPSKPTPPPSKPNGPPSPPPKDFGTCPCPNCIGGGPVVKTPSNGKAPSKPTLPPSKPNSSPSSPPKDFGTCPCPNCTSGGPATKTPSNDKPPSKPPPPPSKPKGPPSSPPKDFGKCPCPNCQSGQSHVPTTPPPRTPSNDKPGTKSKDNSEPHTFNCPCLECRYYGKPLTSSKQGGKCFQSGNSPALSACSYRTTGGEGSQGVECTCDCMCALCSLSPKYDIQVNVSVDGQPQPKHGGTYQSPIVVNKGITNSDCCCTCPCECCLRARKFCEPQRRLCKGSPGDPGSKKGQVVIDVGADGRPNVLVNGKLEETRKRHTEEFRTKSPKGSEWLTERIYDNYMRTVVEERQRRLNAPKSVSPLPLANSNRGGRSYEPAYHSPLSLSVIGPEAIPSETETRSAQSSSPPINPAESVFSDDGSDRFDRSFVPSNTLSPRFPSSPIPLKRKSAVRQSRPTSVASSIDLRSVTSSLFERRNEMANAKNNWEHPVCPVCTEICYLIDKVSFDGVIYHKQCLKCHECKRPLHASNCVRVRDHLYCMYHGGYLLRRRSMLIGPEANRPKPGRRRPPSSSRRKGGESSRGSSPSLSSTCHACGCTCHTTGIPIQVGGAYGDHCGGAGRDTEGRSTMATPCPCGCGAPKAKGQPGGYRNATSPISPSNNPFRLLNREISSLEQRFKETEDVMRQSFRSKGISINRQDGSGSRGSGSSAHFPIRT